MALLADLRQLVNRFDGAETDDQARELADELAALLRRARAQLAAAARRTNRAAQPATG